LFLLPKLSATKSTKSTKIPKENNVMGYAQIPSEDEELAHQIVGAAIEVHRILGPGFLESVYEKALEYELKSRGLGVQGSRNLLCISRRAALKK
jgi:hypothetical protein